MRFTLDIILITPSSSIHHCSPTINLYYSANLNYNYKPIKSQQYPYYDHDKLQASMQFHLPYFDSVTPIASAVLFIEP